MATACMLSITCACGSSQSSQSSKRDVADSLSAYRTVLGYMQRNSMLPLERIGPDSLVPVLVVGDLPCPNCGFNIEDFAGYFEMKAVANSDEYAGYPKLLVKQQCKDLKWPAMSYLSTTKDTWVIVRFDQIDSFDFSPLRMVNCTVYDNVYHRDAPVWYDMGEAKYYMYSFFVDSRDSIVRYYGGLLER